MAYQMNRRLEPDDKDRSVTRDAPDKDDGYARLRAELLVSGLSHWVSLGEVQQIISHFELADTDKERQDLVVGTIRSLLEDGLMQIGELPEPDGSFPAWEPSDVAMHRLRKRFVGHYDEPASWVYSARSLAMNCRSRPSAEPMDQR